MRLIDADALLSAVMTQDVVDKSVVKRLIIQVPTVDAEPVRHGHWNHVSREFAAGEGADMYAQCSECGTIELVYTRAYAKRWKYCPYCGAKMDGERKDDEAD